MVNKHTKTAHPQMKASMNYHWHVLYQQQRLSLSIPNAGKISVSTCVVCVAVGRQTGTILVESYVTSRKVERVYLVRLNHSTPVETRPASCIYVYKCP